MKLRKIFSVPFVLGLAVGVIATQAAADMLGSAVFPDVPAGSYFDGAIGRLYGAGVVKGGPDGKFHPGDYVSRADVAVMIDRAMNGGGFVASSSSSSRSRSSSSSSVSSSSSTSSSSSSSSSSLAPVGDAGAFKFTSETVSISEGANNVSISISRYSGKKGAVTVHYATSNGTASEGSDYNAASGTVSFADGETTKVLSLKFINDVVGEATENFTVTLSDPTGGAVLGTPTVATVNILDNDGGPGSGGTASSSSNSSATVGGNYFTFGAWAYSADENAGSATVTVLRKGNTDAAATVKYSSTDGSAKSGTDYTLSPGTLSFAAGETSKTFTVQVADTAAIEGNRSFTLKLTDATGGPTVGNPGNISFTVVDNESTSAGSGTVLFSAESYTVREKDGNATINILRRGDLSKTVSVKYATSDSTATSGSDYTAANGTMTFAPNETSKSFVIPLTADTLTENEERVNLTLSDAVGTLIGTTSTAVLKITD